MNKEDRFSPPAVGGISMLVAFAVLCLTVFALLSLSTVQAQSRLADASTRAVAEYYAADSAAVQILARLCAGDSPEEVTYQNGIYAYACPISETQVLEVEVRLSGEDYEILRWQAVPDGQEGEESGFELWDGEGF